MSRLQDRGYGWKVRGGILVAVGIALAGVNSLATAAGGPSLGEAENFGVLGSTTVTSEGATAVIGSVGVSPGTSIIGFPPGVVTGGALHAGDATAAAARADATTAYGVLEAMTVPTGNDLTGTDLGGLTLVPGVYGFTSTAQLTGTLTLDAGCDPGALFVFKVGSALTTAASSSVVVINGGWDYDELNVFWQIGSSATLAAGSDLTGNFIALASITIADGAAIEGRALALTGTVSMVAAEVTAPAPPPPPGTVLITQYWGHVTDVKAANKDVTQVRASYEYSGSPDGVMDPKNEGMTVVLGPKGETDQLTVVIPPGSTRWKLKKGYWTWVKRVDGINWKVQLDDTEQLLLVLVSRFDFQPGSGAAQNWGPEEGFHPVLLSIVVGNDSGAERGCFRNSSVFNHTRNWSVLRIP